MKKILIYILVILSIFLFACNNKTSYKIIYEEKGYDLETFDISDISIRIVEKGSVRYQVVNSNMLSKDDNDKLNKAGTHNITIMLDDKEFEIKVILKGNKELKDLETFSITNFDTSTYYVGNTKKIEYTYTPIDANLDITYESSDTETARINDGYLICLKKGTANISIINNKNKNVLDTVTISVEEKALTLDTYYSTIGGLDKMSSSDLKTILHNLIDEHISGSYNLLKDILPNSDKDPNNSKNMILFYTGRSQGGAIGSSGDEWNREHIWPLSRLGGNTSLTAGHDAHHIRPTDASVNGVRGNLDFGEGGTKVIDTYGAGSSFCYVDKDTFEPRDEVKGDVARMLFYMAVRYEGDVNGEMDLELTRSKIGGKGLMGNLELLLKWNKEDPVDDFERNRNDVIYSYQKNKNPFIDHPEYADYIWSK